MRTIVDLFRRGSQELFHSSVLAWLLDPSAEHEFGDLFLRGFLGLAENRSQQGIPLKNLGDAKVATEVVSEGGRNDIVITTEAAKVVIENKTKSVGGSAQLRGYTSLGYPLVALGFTEMSFPQGTPCLITYSDVLELLRELPTDGANDFQVVVDHYRRFLERECSVIASLDSRFVQGPDTGGVSPLEECSDRSLYSENDLRAFKHYLLERFRRAYLIDGALGGSWSTDKNQQSGVWVAGTPSTFQRSDTLNQLLAPGDKPWFHVELHDGPFALTPSTPAGVLQLRTTSGGSNRALLDGFKKSFPDTSAFRYPKHLREDSGTFFLALQPLTRADLVFPELATKLGSFMAMFGELA